MKNSGHTKDPWIASSAFQKSLRRGDVEQAIKAADVLLRYDSVRLWRRICVIALEDIGIANLEAVLDTLDMAGRKGRRGEGATEKENAARLIQKLSCSVKCRDACDLAVLVDLASALQGERAMFADLSQEQLADVIVSTAPISVRMVAAWYLAGTDRFPGVNLPPRPGSPRLFLEVLDTLGIPRHVLDVVKLGMARIREPHAIALPFVWLDATSSDNCSVERHRLNPTPLVQGWPSFALDMHTRVGRRAIELFARRCKPLHRLVEKQLPPAARPDILGSLVFRAEGALVDRRLVYTGANELLAASTTAQLTYTGMPQNLALEALEVTREHLELLHTCRLEIVGEF